MSSGSTPDCTKIAEDAGANENPVSLYQTLLTPHTISTAANREAGARNCPFESAPARRDERCWAGECCSAVSAFRQPTNAGPGRFSKNSLIKGNQASYTLRSVGQPWSTLEAARGTHLGSADQPWRGCPALDSPHGGGPSIRWPSVLALNRASTKAHNRGAREQLSYLERADRLSIINEKTVGINRHQGQKIGRHSPPGSSRAINCRVVSGL